MVERVVSDRMARILRQAAEEQPYPLPDGDMSLKVVCVDFDGVLAENMWPSPMLGELNEEAAKMVKWYTEQGYAVIVYTARPQSHEADIWDWLYAAELASYIYDVVTGKPAACLYIDDRARRWPL